MNIISNESFNEWRPVLGDDILPTAILEWVLHYCEERRHGIMVTAGHEPKRP